MHSMQLPATAQLFSLYFGKHRHICRVRVHQTSHSLIRRLRCDSFPLFLFPSLDVHLLYPRRSICLTRHSISPASLPLPEATPACSLHAACYYERVKRRGKNRVYYVPHPVIKGLRVRDTDVVRKSIPCVGLQLEFWEYRKRQRMVMKVCRDLEPWLLKGRKCKVVSFRFSPMSQLIPVSCSLHYRGS